MFDLDSLSWVQHVDVKRDVGFMGWRHSGELWWMRAKTRFQGILLFPKLNFQVRLYCHPAASVEIANSC